MSSTKKITINNNASMSTTKKHTVGILGGTFDPIHNGHIEPAISVAKHLHLDELRLLPAHIPPHKGTPSASPKQREEMANLVCLNNPIFTLDNRELISNKTSYTVNTLKALKQETPNTAYFFIIGMDSLQTFTTWHLWEDILNYCHIIVNIRPGYSSTDFNDETLALLKKYQRHTMTDLFTQDFGFIYIYEGVEKNISSTQIKYAIKNHTTTPHPNKKCETSFLPSYIQSYIDKHLLYK